MFCLQKFSVFIATCNHLLFCLLFCLHFERTSAFKTLTGSPIFSHDPIIISHYSKNCTY